MPHDDPNLTAYVLGECHEQLDLDADALAIAQQTALIANILTTHLTRPRRRIRRLPQTFAASLLLLILCSPARQLVIAPAPQPQVAQVHHHDSPTFRLTLAVAESPHSPLLADAVAEGNDSFDVDQLVATVLDDASRLATFSSLRLSADSPESLVAFQ